MALPATHIKFAAQREADLNIEDKSKYYSGTLYPDTRYATGIDRGKTHFSELLPADKHENDFNKGWAVHQLCDEQQAEIVHDIFSDLDPVGKSQQWWTRFSAIKAAHDMYDMREFEMENYLEYLDFVQPQFENESEAKIEQYYNTVSDAYSDYKIPETYNKILEILTIEDEIGKKANEMATKILAEEKEKLQKITTRLYK